MAHENPYQSPSDPDHLRTPIRGTLERNVVLRGSMPVGDVFHSQFLIVSRHWPYVALCLLIYALFVIALAVVNRANSLFSSTYLLLGLIVMPGILPLSLLLVYLRLRRDARRRVGIFAVTESTLTPQGIEASMHGANVSVPWTAFSGFVPSPRVIILFLKESNSHLIVSRTKLTRQDDWPMLLSFLHERLPRR